VGPRKALRMWSMFLRVWSTLLRMWRSFISGSLREKRGCRDPARGESGWVRTRGGGAGLFGRGLRWRRKKVRTEHVLRNVFRFASSSFSHYFSAPISANSSMAHKS